MGYLVNKKIFVSTGELSGDQLGFELVRNLIEKEKTLEFAGVVGPAMRKLPIKALAHIEELSIMGFKDVLFNSPRLKVLESALLEQILAFNPDCCVLIDFPGLHFRIGRKLREKGIKVIQFVAPKVWAWGRWRVHKLNRSFDMVLGILPFEVGFFESYGVHYRYVGNPHAIRIKQVRSLSKESIGLRGQAVCFLPGSRKSEIDHSLDTLRYLDENLDRGIDIVVVIAQSCPLETYIQKVFPEYKSSLEERSGVKIRRKGRVIFTQGQHLSIMKACDVAVATSGTVTLELALLKIPTAVIYRTSAMGFFIGKKIIKVKYLSLPNLILDKEVFREFIQVDDQKSILEYLCLLLDHDGDYVKSIHKDLRSIEKSLSKDPWENITNILQEVIP